MIETGSSHFNFNLEVIPNSIKILLENLIRNEDGESINDKMIDSLCSKINNEDNLLIISDEKFLIQKKLFGKDSFLKLSIGKKKHIKINLA